MKRIDFDNSDGSRPSIRLLISDDQFHQFKLDTGAGNSEVSLETVLFQKLKRKGRILVEGGGGAAGIGGIAYSPPGTLDSVELGDLRFRNVHVTSGPLQIVGLKFFERFEAELDFPNRKAYFRPGKRLHSRSRKNLSHFAVKIDKNKLVVLGCRGIAQDAGIRIDDVLVEINGRPARELTISEFRRLQCLPDTKLTLQFERQGSLFDATLRLKQPSNPFPDDTSDTGSDESSK